MTTPPMRIDATSPESAAVPKIVCMIGMPRTGSTHLMRLLKGCPEFYVKSELFKQGYKLRRADKRAIMAASGLTPDDELTKWRRLNPAKVLDIVFESGGRRPVFIKLFPGHLSERQIEAEIFPRSDVRYISLRRRPIECFISHCKARHYGVHGRVDTTSLKPTLKAKPFAFWARKARAWEDWIEAERAAKQLSFLDLIYETQLENVASDVALAGILDRLAGLGLPKVSLPKRIPSGERQDREPDYRARVANWAEFERQVRSVSAHAALLDWAEAMPGEPFELPRASAPASDGQDRPTNGAANPADQTDAKEERRRQRREQRRAEKSAIRSAGKRGRERTAQ
jgi:hypothetical protein